MTMAIVATETLSWGQVAYTAPVIRRTPGKAEIEYDFIHTGSRGGDYHGYDVITVERDSETGAVRMFCRCDTLEIPAHLTATVVEALAMVGTAGIA